MPGAAKELTFMCRLISSYPTSLFSQGIPSMVQDVSGPIKIRLCFSYQPSNIRVLQACMNLLWYQHHRFPQTVMSIPDTFLKTAELCIITAESGFRTASSITIFCQIQSPCCSGCHQSPKQRQAFSAVTPADSVPRVFCAKRQAIFRMNSLRGRRYPHHSEHAAAL